MTMHRIQGKILELASRVNLFPLTLREIGEKVDEAHPQKIKHHLSQLYTKGYLKLDKKSKTISCIGTDTLGTMLYPIPILGYANCGQALAFADENFEGYLQISRSLVPNFEKDRTFAVKAIGDSMNDAKINGEPLEDGNYAIVDTTKHDLEFYNNKYVLSVIDGMANIKKLRKDDKNQQVILLSESKSDYPPIVIGYSDFQGYLINGEIKQVIKT